MTGFKYFLLIFLFMDIIFSRNVFANSLSQYNDDIKYGIVSQYAYDNEDDISMVIRDGKIFFDDKVDSIVIIDITGKTVYRGIDVYSADFGYKRGVYVIVVVRNKMTKTFKVRI